MADDLGCGHLGCYSQQKIRTPHLDRMAAEGMRFTDMYSGCCVCAPSRSVLMTGRHGGHTAVRGNIGGFPLAPEDITIAEAQHPRVVAELNQRLNDSRKNLTRRLNRRGHLGDRFNKPDRPNHRR